MGQPNGGTYELAIQYSLIFKTELGLKFSFGRWPTFKQTDKGILAMFPLSDFISHTTQQQRRQTLKSIFL